MPDYFIYFQMLIKEKKRYKGVTSNFIDEGIYWQLNEMHITGKLSRVIKDIDKLKKKLLKDTYWNDEMSKMKYRNRIYKICWGHLTSKVKTQCNMVEEDN